MATRAEIDEFYGPPPAPLPVMYDETGDDVDQPKPRESQAIGEIRSAGNRIADLVGELEGLRAGEAIEITREATASDDDARGVARAMLTGYHLQLESQSARLTRELVEFVALVTTAIDPDSKDDTDGGVAAGEKG